MDPSIMRKSQEKGEVPQYRVYVANTMEKQRAKICILKIQNQMAYENLLA